MWLAWLFAAFIAAMEAHYLTKNVSTLNSFSKPFGVFATGVCVIPVLFCVALRFWLSRFRNAWLALVPFLIGVFFAWDSSINGIFLFPEFFIVFQILSAILFLLFLPSLLKV